MDAAIYTLIRGADWRAAERAGAYRGSADDARDGFLHFSTAAQVRESAAKHRRGEPDLWLIEADAARLGGAVEVVIGSAEIFVADNGKGIPPDQLPFLFTPFHRGETGSAGESEAGESGVGGSGLGLALSRRLMQAMDGDLTLVTSSAEGTTFRLVLPSASPAAVSRELRVPASTR